MMISLEFTCKLNKHQIQIGSSKSEAIIANSSNNTTKLLHTGLNKKKTVEKKTTFSPSNFKLLRGGWGSWKLAQLQEIKPQLIFQKIAL